MDVIKQSHSRWYFQPWIGITLLFLFFPAGIILFLLNPVFRLRDRVLVFLSVAGLIYAAVKLTPFYQSFENRLLIERYSEARNLFLYDEAGSYLARLKSKSSLDQLEFELLSMEHEESLGRLSVSSEPLRTLLKNCVSDISLIVPEFSTVSERFKRQELELMKYLPLPVSEEKKDDSLRLFSNLNSRLVRFLILYGGDLRLTEEAIATACALIPCLPDNWASFNLKLLYMGYLLKFAPNEIESVEKSWGRRLEEELSEYVIQSPFHLDAWNLRGDYRYHKGELELAVADWMHVFSLDVFHAGVYKKLKSLKTDTLNYELLEKYYQGETFRFTNGDFQTSERLFGEVLKTDDDTAELLRIETMFNLGVMYRNNLRDHQKAQEYFAKILEEEPQGMRVEESLYNLVMCAMQTGDFKATERYVIELLDRFPGTDHRGRLILIRFYLKLRSSAIRAVKKIGGGEKHDST
jgi:tetratricopeptide (TPR) repeat protein